MTHMPITPLMRIKLWCKSRGISYEELCALERSKPRQKLMCDLKREFPKLSASKVGELLGGRNHTTVLYAWHQAKLIPEKRRFDYKMLTPSEIVEARALWEKGATTKKALCAKYGVSFHILKKQLFPDWYEERKLRAEVKRKEVVELRKASKSKVAKSKVSWHDPNIEKQRRLK